MQKKRLFRRLAIAVLITLALFLLYKNLGADEKTAAQKSKEINLHYEEALGLYLQGQYVKAKEKLNHILKTLNSDPYIESWRKSRDIKPTRQYVSQMIREIEAYDQQEKQRPQVLSQETRLSKEARKARRQAELARREEERRKRAEELRAQREEERKAKQEELARQKEERARQLAELRAKREEERKTKQAELTRLKEERGKQLVELRVKREAELKAKQAELARRKEEQAKRQEELRAQREAERRAKEQELVLKRKERAQQLVELKTKREEERKTKEAELARKKEERAQQQAELKAQREAELKARQAELARKKEERAQQQAELKTKREEERRAKEEELTRRREEQAKQQAELKAKKEAERQAKQAELARKQEEQARHQEELKTKREEERKTKEAELARKKEERAQQQAELKAKRETELKAKQAELARREEERRRREEELRAKREEEHKAREEKLAKQKEEKLIQQQQAQLSKIADERHKQQKELKREKRELKEFQAKMQEMKRSVVQDKAITEAMLKKKQEDTAKIKKIEELWRRARKLYSQGMYEEAVKNFEEVIRLEGNPRIKYTPSAKEYIQKAKEQLIEKNQTTYLIELERMEKEMINEVLKQQIPPYIEPPARIEKKPEPTFLIEPPLIRKKLKEVKITMDFDKVGLKSAMGFFSQESGINFIASQKVLELAPVVSASFKETALDEVTKYITKSLGLAYRIDKEVVWIAHPEEIANEPMETRVYYLNKGGGLFTEFSPISSGTTETGLGGSSAQINKIFTIEDTLKEIISWPADAKLTYDKRLNALIVRNTPQNLQMLEDMLYSLDIEPCQVLIEARFLEVDITDVTELGLEWKFTEDFAVEKDMQADGTRGIRHGIAQDGGVDFTAFTNVAEGLNLTYKGVLTRPQFQTVLHALNKVTKVKTLSSPRITTLNNQMATIKVVDEWIYPTRYEYEVVQTDINGDGDFDDANETTYKNVPKDFLRRDVGILLKVLPAVGADRKTVNLSLIPEVSEGTASGFSYTGDITLPKFTSRNLSTTVVVNSGDTVVLGGLVKESRTNVITKVPILGDIPLMGAFFRKKSDNIQRKNLLIFVTAKVLSSAGEEMIASQK